MLFEEVELDIMDKTFINNYSLTSDKQIICDVENT